MANEPRTSGVFSLGALGGDGAATSDDLNWSDVVLLLDGSSTTDLSSASPTVTFTSSGISAGNSGGKYGQYIDLQDSGYITVGLGQNIGANGDPFTVETWARFDSQSDEGIFNLTTTGSFNNASNSISIGTNGTSWNIYHDGGASQQVSPGPSNATWYHVAVVFDGTNLVYYVGGSAILTKSNHSANIPAAGYSTVMIGGYFSTSYVMNGRIEDFRVTDGVARYNGPFTPPQEALPQATAAATRPTRRWGGMTGRSLVESGNVPTTGVLSLPELLQASYGTAAAAPDGLTSATAATSAAQILLDYPSAGDGIYWIDDGGTAKQVYCDMTNDGGGWMLYTSFATNSTYDVTNYPAWNVNRLGAADMRSASPQYGWSDNSQNGRDGTTTWGSIGNNTQYTDAADGPVYLFWDHQTTGLKGVTMTTWNGPSTITELRVGWGKGSSNYSGTALANSLLVNNVNSTNSPQSSVTFNHEVVSFNPSGATPLLGAYESGNSGLLGVNGISAVWMR